MTERNNMDTFHQSAWADEEFSKNYLEKADIYIPERRKMIGTMSSLFDYFYHDKRGSYVLDLGCGDGVLTEALLAKQDSLIATLVDGSRTMLQKARERLKSHPQLSFVQASFQDILTGRASLENYDFCVSSMAIHHLDMKEKAALFKYIAGHLKSNGRFVNIDVVLPASEELEEWYFSHWREWMQKMFGQINVKDEVPEDIIRRYKDPASMNRPDTLADQLEALKDAGLSEVDCYYKNGIFTVFGGKK